MTRLVATFAFILLSAIAVHRSAQAVSVNDGFSINATNAGLSIGLDDGFPTTATITASGLPALAG